MSANILRNSSDMVSWSDSSTTFRQAAKLEKAMRKERLVRFTYDGKTRVVEVHALGTSTKDGTLLLRGFQVAGDSSRPLPQWTLYTVAKIGDDLTVVKDGRSYAPRQGYVENDAQMRQILSQLLEA